MRLSRFAVLVLALALVHVGCDGTGGPILSPDGGADAPDAFRSDGGVDAGEDDHERPVIEATTPDDGASDVAATATIEVVFSEAMDEEAGTVAVRVDGVALATTQTLDGDTLTITPSAPLPSNARVRVTIDDDFADLAGNTLALPYEITFDVGDFDPPVVAASEPAQGATGLSARMDALTITFDETMISSSGTVTLEGGAGALGTPRWIDGHTLTLPVSGLAYDTTYRFVLDGFEDAATNALDATTYLVDGAIEITTGTDDEAPRISDAAPSEGQVNVSLRGTPSVTIVFDEPMDTSAGVATLVVGAESNVLPETWTDGGTRLSLAISGRLRPDAEHAVRLEGFTDVEGNALDLVTFLEDGELDFDTGADVTAPVVVYSTPNEASATADHLLESIEIVFDRGMDTTLTTLTVDDGVAPFDADVTWNLAGTIASLDVATRMHTGRSYRIDLRSAIDLTGQPIVVDHPYLDDGQLDFGMRAPSGEQCRDEATIAEATATLPSGGYEWVFPGGTLAIIDNGASCRYAGGPTSQRPDAVVRYSKTTPSASSGGRYLHVSVEGPNVGSRVSLAVYRDVCMGDLAARETCLWDRWRWDRYLDVGAGEYFVWGGQTSSTVGQLTIRVEEVDAVPDGESCANPFDTTSTIHSLVGEQHVWTVPMDGYAAPDMDTEYPGDGAASCDADHVQGSDFVVQYDKAAADSLVNVIVEPTASSTYYVNVTASATCDTRGSASELACGTELFAGTSGRAGPRLYTLTAPAGPLYVWVSNAEQDNTSTPVTVRMQEIPSTPGTSCANAITLVPGPNTITPTSPARVAEPSCFGNVNTGDGQLDDGITWYRFTSTDRATIFRADVPGAVSSATSTLGSMAVVDAASGQELGCARDAASSPIAAITPTGTDVCVAVRQSSGISRIDVSSATYTGIGTTITDLAILPPVSATGGDIPVTAANWMVVTPTTIYMHRNSSQVADHGLLSASRGGHVRAELRLMANATFANAGISIGEAVWVMGNSAAAGTTSRFSRVVDSTGAATTTAWDGGYTWPADAFDGVFFDGTSILASSDGATAIRPTLRRFDPTTPGAPTTMGVVGSDLSDLIGLAADATWIYFAGSRATTPNPTRGIFRIRRADIGTTVVPQRISGLPIVADTSTSLVARVPMAIDDTTTAHFLYARDANGDVHVIADPGGAAPIEIGRILGLGGVGDFPMALDPSIPALFLFETETVATGRFVRVE